MGCTSLQMQPAPLTGTATFNGQGFKLSDELEDATRTPHGDGNLIRFFASTRVSKMQPAPLTGTAT